MRVIIIGKGAGKEKAPYAINDGEVWGVNNVCMMRTVDLAFNMHDLEKHRDHKLFKKTVDYVNRNHIPIVTQRKYDWIPTCREFPLEDLERIGFRLYFTNSIDYMVAYAVYQRCVVLEEGSIPPERVLSEIEMYGVVMLTGTEYAIQRPSLEYWCGVFEGLGGSILIHPPTYVLRPPHEGFYGYDWDEEDLPHVKGRSENQ